MSVTIFSKRLGINRSYVIKADGCIRVDTGPSQSARAIEKWLDDILITPQEIQLIILTHGHADHVGSAWKVKELTGAKIAIHESDRYMFEKEQVIWPSAVSAWGHVGRVLLRPVSPLFKFTGGKIDIVIKDDGLSLEKYGIPGSVIHTPGHTPGSVSVLLETGDAFVGCMTHNAPPFRLNPGLPIFAEDLPGLKESWELLLDRGAKNIYPGHGDVFSADEILKALS
jgi:glyoxylase-like metal-dependent hydrolase (beta-lactamase superfamily II)